MYATLKCAACAGGSGAVAESSAQGSGAAAAERLPARHVATLDVLLKELLTERSSAMALQPFTVSEVMQRLRKANLSFPEAAVIQVLLFAQGEHICDSSQQMMMLSQQMGSVLPMLFLPS